jgi:hypothetical protein
MTTTTRTILLACAIFLAGAASGAAGLLIAQRAGTTSDGRASAWEDRLRRKLTADLDLDAAMLAAGGPAIRQAAEALHAARRADEQRTDDILRTLAAELAPHLDTPRLDELRRRLDERTANWRSRLGP